MPNPEMFRPSGDEEEVFAGEVEAKSEEQARLEREWMRPGDIAAWSRVRDRIESLLDAELPDVSVEFDTIGTSRREIEAGRGKKAPARDFEHASFIFRDEESLEPFLIERVDSVLLDAYGTKPPEEIAAAFVAKARKAYEKRARRGK